MTANEAYSKVVFGPAFGKMLDGLVKDAIKKGNLYFKVPTNMFPANLNIDDVLAAFTIVGYSFERFENEGKEDACVVVGFSFQLDDNRRKN